MQCKHSAFLQNLSQDLVHWFQCGLVLSKNSIKRADIEAVNRADNEQHDVFAQSCLFNEVLREEKSHVEAIAGSQF